MISLANEGDGIAYPKFQEFGQVDHHKYPVITFFKILPFNYSFFQSAGFAFNFRACSDHSNAFGM